MDATFVERGSESACVNDRIQGSDTYLEAYWSLFPQRGDQFDNGTFVCEAAFVLTVGYLNSTSGSFLSDETEKT